MLLFGLECCCYCLQPVALRGLFNFSFGASDTSGVVTPSALEAKPAAPVAKDDNNGDSSSDDDDDNSSSSSSSDDESDAVVATLVKPLLAQSKSKSKSTDADASSVSSGIDSDASNSDSDSDAGDKSVGVGVAAVSMVVESPEAEAGDEEVNTPVITVEDPIARHMATAAVVNIPEIFDIGKGKIITTTTTLKSEINCFVEAIIG